MRADARRRYRRQGNAMRIVQIVMLLGAIALLIWLLTGGGTPGVGSGGGAGDAETPSELADPSEIGLPDFQFTSVQAPVRAAIENAALDVRTAPNDGDAWGELAMVLDAHDMTVDAITCYRRAIAEEGNDGRWKYFLARSLSKCDEQTGAASAQFNLAAQVLPTHAPLWVRWGDLELHRGDAARARTFYARARDLNGELLRAHRGEAWAALASEEIDDAIELFERAHEIFDQDAGVLWGLAQAYRRAGRHEDAAAAAIKAEDREFISALPDEMFLAVTSRGQSSTVRRRHAHQALALGAHDDALDHARKVVELEPRAADMHVLIGQCLDAKQQHREAAEAYRTAMHCDEKSVQGALGGGAALMRDGAFNEASIFYSEAVRREPRVASHRYALAISLQRVGRHHESIDEFMRAAAIGPPHAEAAFRWGNAYAMLARAEEAVDRYELTVRLAPDYAAAWLNLGIALERLEQRERALDAYLRAERLDPASRARGLRLELENR